MENHHSFVYLACPHEHEDHNVENQRAKIVTHVAACLTNLGLRVYSPITHSIALKECGAILSHGEWMMFDMPYMDHASMLMVLMLEGWEHSKEINMEIKKFTKDKKPILYLNPSDYWDNV